MTGYLGSDVVPAESLWTAQAAIAAHLSPITAIAPVPGSDAVITSGYDGHVIRWSADLARPVWAQRFDDLVNAVTVDADGRYVGVAVADGYAYVLDVASGRTVHRLGRHGDDVNDVAWSPDGTQLAVVCDAEDLAVRLWDVRDEPAAARLHAHNHGVFAVGYSPDGTRLATASEDGTVRIWDLGGKPAVRHVLEHPGDVETLGWSPDGDWLATGCDDGRLRLWATADMRLAIDHADARASVRKVGFSPCGTRVFGASYDGVVRIYGMTGTSPVAEVTGPLQWERAAAMVDRDTIVVGSFGGRPSRRTPGDTPPAVVPTWGVNSLALLDDGRVFTGTDCGVVTEVTTDHVVTDVGTLVCGLAVDGQREKIAVTDYLGRLFVGSTKGDVALVSSVSGGPLNTLAMLPGGGFATGGYDGAIRHWSADGRELARVEAHAGPIKSVTWVAGADALVAGSSDDTLSVWTIGASLTEESRFAADDLVLVNAVAAPAKQPWVAVASRDCSVRLIDPLAGRLLGRLPRIHTKSVKAIGVSPDGSLIVTGSYDGTVCFWHLDHDQALLGWRQHRLHGKPGVPCVRVGDTRVATAGWDGTVAVWSHDGELLQRYSRTGR